MVCLIAGGDNCALVNQLSTLKPTGDLRKNFSRPHINLLLHVSVLEWAVDSFYSVDYSLLLLLLTLKLRLPQIWPVRAFHTGFCVLLTHPHNSLSTFWCT